MMNRPARLLTAAACTAALAACATPSEPPPPAPVTYAGADNVGAIDAAMITGNWTARILNPAYGSEPSPYEISYAPDGSMTYTMDDTQSGLKMKLRGEGTWQVRGEEVVAQIESVKDISGSAISGLIARMMTSMKDRMTGSANVYEASADRVVMVGQDGVAVELTRR